MIKQPGISQEPQQLIKRNKMGDNVESVTKGMKETSMRFRRNNGTYIFKRRGKGWRLEHT